MLQFVILVLTLIFGHWLEKLNRSNSIGFSFLTLLLAIAFSSSNIVQSTDEFAIGDRNNLSISTINLRGGNNSTDFDLPDVTQGFYLPPNRPVRPEPRPRPQDRDPKSSSADHEIKPHYPFGIDPNYKPNANRPDSALSANQVPDEEDWINDPNAWDKFDDQDSEKENGKKFEKLNVDYEYEYDSNHNPILLIPDPEKKFSRRGVVKVDYDQTTTHIHHATKHGMKLPKSFDMKEYNKYESGSRERMEYAKTHLSREFIISYQNLLGHALTQPRGSKKILGVTGYAGKDKRNTSMAINRSDDNQNNMLSIIREDDTHITSYPIDGRRLKKLVDDGFWVLKDRTL